MPHISTSAVATNAYDGSRWREGNVTVGVGEVQSLWRYPVRSMRGEALDSVVVTPRGLMGDRCYGVVDVEEGCGAEASYVPLRWAGLLAASATLLSEPVAGEAPPGVSIRFDDGAERTSADPEVGGWLSERFGRPAALWHAPDSDGASNAGGVAEVSGEAQSLELASARDELAWGYDRAPIHLLTTSSLRAASELHPKGEFAPERFRPNIVLDTGDNAGFLESAWIGHELALGPELRLEVVAPCERCTVPTQPLGRLGRDPRILSTITRHNDTNMGVYARVVSPGRLRRRDTAELA